ncbi:unnamed protein product [Symbiodinium sp. CCMP2592]|nr:unnamed protein product [Symbiodinium sp. CCMP2592]
MSDGADSWDAFLCHGSYETFMPTSRRRCWRFTPGSDEGGTLRQINRQEAEKLIRTTTGDFRRREVRKWRLGTHFTEVHRYHDWNDPRDGELVREDCRRAQEAARLNDVSRVRGPLLELHGVYRLDGVSLVLQWLLGRTDNPIRHEVAVPSHRQEKHRHLRLPKPCFDLSFAESSDNESNAPSFGSKARSSFRPGDAEPVCHRRPLLRRHWTMKSFDSSRGYAEMPMSSREIHESEYTIQGDKSTVPSVFRLGDATRATLDCSNAQSLGCRECGKHDLRSRAVAVGDRGSSDSMGWWQRIEETLDDHRRDVRLLGLRIESLEGELLRPSTTTDKQSIFARVEEIAENIEDLCQMNHMEIFR